MEAKDPTKESMNDRETAADDVESTTRDDKVTEETKDFESMIPS